MRILSKLFEVKKDKDESFIDDRRCSKRYELPLKLSYHDPTRGFSGENLTKNISKTGLRFPINTKVPKGTILNLKIEDPNSSSLIHSKAKVIWIEQLEVGVKLLKKRLY